MARYEYLCKDCGSTFELQRSMADAEGDVRCVSCSGADVRRRFSVFAMASSSGGTSGAPAAPVAAGGGCCGGACGCR